MKPASLKTDLDHVLFWLSSEGPLPIAELCRRLGTRNWRITRAKGRDYLRKLARENVIRRVRNAEDEACYEVAT